MRLHSALSADTASQGDWIPGSTLVMVGKRLDIFLLDILPENQEDRSEGRRLGNGEMYDT